MVAVSKFTKDDFCDFSGFPPDRVVVAHLSAGQCFRPVQDLERVLSRSRRVGTAQNNPFLLSVANPQPRKNIPLLIRSFLTALPAGCHLGQADWFLLAILRRDGGSSDRSGIDKHPQFADRIIRARGVPDEDLACLYSECEAFVFHRHMKALDFQSWKRSNAGRRSFPLIGARFRRSRATRQSW